jgi:hypothetical protein
MYYECRSIIIQHEYDLNRATASASPPNQPFVFLIATWVRPLRTLDYKFRLGRSHPMTGNVIDVPRNPTKVHGRVLI